MQGQREVYTKLLANFKDDEHLLNKPVDCSEKEQELEKGFKQQERKKLERKMKKDVNDWDEMFNGNPALCQSAKGCLTLGDRLMKIVNDSMKKSLKKLQTGEQQRMETLSTKDEVVKSLESNMNKRATLETMTEKIFERNRQLYIDHEQMLDDEKKYRREIANDF